MMSLLITFYMWVGMMIMNHDEDHRETADDDCYHSDDNHDNQIANIRSRE